MSYEWTNPPADMPNRLRASRAWADITQKDMAQHLGVDRATIRNWEAGRLPKGHALRGLIESYIEHTGINRRWFEVEKLNIGQFIVTGEIHPRPGSAAGVAEKAKKAKAAIRQGKAQAAPETRPRKQAGS